MKRAEVKVGKVYSHKLDGRDWLVRITALDKEISESRPGQWGWTGELLDGQSESGSCWGFVSELSEGVCSNM